MTLFFWVIMLHVFFKKKAHRGIKNENFATRIYLHSSSRCKAESTDFAFVEYTHSLRLVRELAEVCAPVSARCTKCEQNQGEGLVYHPQFIEAWNWHEVPYGISLEGWMASSRREGGWIRASRNAMRDFVAIKSCKAG